MSYKLDELTHALQLSWGQDTCCGGKKWSKANPARGQCVVSSLVIQDYLGGDILRYEVSVGNRKETHYCNILDDGTIVDTTGTQYKTSVTMKVKPVDIHSYKSLREKRLADPKTNERYKSLAKRVKKALPDKYHYCHNPKSFPLNKYLQKGTGKGSKILIIGESPAEKGWRISGKACYTPDGKILPTGRNLNRLLEPLGLSVEQCGFTELVKCYIGKDRKLLDQCAPGCWQILLDQINYTQPELLIILGVQTTKLLYKLTNTELTIGQISNLQLNSRNYKVLPIYHPSPISPSNHRKNTIIFTELGSKLLS